MGPHVQIWAKEASDKTAYLYLLARAALSSSKFQTLINFVSHGNKSTKIKIANERVEMALQETERLKAWAEMAAVEARKAEAEAIMFQVEAEKQKELDVAEADRLKEALENCQN